MAVWFGVVFFFLLCPSASADPVTVGVLATMATAAGASAATAVTIGTIGAASLYGAGAYALGKEAKDKFIDTPKAAKEQAAEKASAAAAEVEKKSILAKESEDATSRKKAALLAQPTSGFGPNTNLARSFLTTL